MSSMGIERADVFWRIMLTILALILVTYSIAASAQPKVRIARSAESFAFIPFFVAKSMGYLENAGFDMAAVRTEQRTATLAAAIGGAAGKLKELDGNIYIVAGAICAWLDTHKDAARKVVPSLQTTRDTIKNAVKTTAPRDGALTNDFFAAPGH